MKMIVIGIVVLILLVGMIRLGRDFYVKRKLRKLTMEKYKIFQPLMMKLIAKETIDEGEVFVMAKNPSIRHAVFGVLEEYGRGDLFPLEYFTYEKAAESFLVNWLEFPTELGTTPNEIELISKIALEENASIHFYVFKYRTFPPHWASQHNWMLGVSGPYGEESTPYDVPLKVFSRFKLVGSVEPEDEVRWVHEHIGR